MHLDDLRIFRTVVQAEGVTRAAALLRRVPSNVTTRIQQLEANLGVKLFARENRRLQLTAQGRQFLESAGQLLQLAEEARAALHEAEPCGVLALGAMDSIAATRLPAPLAEYQRRYPRTRVHLVTGPTRRLVVEVVGRQLEAALVANPPRDGRLEVRPLLAEELVLVSAAGHPPIRTPRDVRYHNFLTFGQGCAYRQRLEDWFAGSGLVPGSISEMGSYHAILGCVAAAMGLALVPRVILEQFPARDALGLHRLPARMAQIEICLIWRKNEDSPRLQAFREILTAACAAGRKGGTLSLRSKAATQSASRGAVVVLEPKGESAGGSKRKHGRTQAS